MPRKLPTFMSELPEPPVYDPVQDAISNTTDPKAAAALQLFASMPASTGILANPVRYHHTVHCNEQPVELSIRSFGIRGCLLEDDIVAGNADALRTIFVGLFGRFPQRDELRTFSRMLSKSFETAIEQISPMVASFMKAHPDATTDLAAQYIAVIRKTGKKPTAIRSISTAALLHELISIHFENCVAGACASYMGALLHERPSAGASTIVRQTGRFLDSLAGEDPFQTLFSLLLRRKVNPAEARILQNLGTIQIHHGSAGSNMVARYLGSLHTRSLRDIFTAAQMTLDSARHFGAIRDLTDFISQLERLPPRRQDQLIYQRALEGNLPTFGHPEISLAGRNNRMELDPRPAIYLFPMFQAIDSGELEVHSRQVRGVTAAQRIYQLAFVEGIEKPGRSGRLRVAPNTDFGAWIVQEILGIDRADRTFISYAFRGFGWMMDVREQLQQPIIRPVIPPDPSIVPAMAANGVIPEVVDAVHNRLCRQKAFERAKEAAR